MLPLVDAVDVIRLVGPRRFARARDLVREGAVATVSGDEHGDVVTGVVRSDAGGTAAPATHAGGVEPAGSGAASADGIEVRVQLRPTHGDYRRPVSSTCTCPLGADCEHVAATLLQATQRSLTRAVPGATAPATTGVGTTTTAGATGPAGVTTASGLLAAREVAAPSWRDRVALLTGAAPEAASTTRLGLLFELRERVRTVARRPGAATAPPAPRLGVRPVMLSRTGNWVRGELGWSSLPHQRHRLGVGAEQHAWFLQFAALHRSVHAAYAPGEGDWLHLDDFSSPLLWPLLDEARRLGVALVTGKRATDVTIGERGALTLGATRDVEGTGDDAVPLGASVLGATPGGALRLTPAVRVDDRSWSAGDAGTIGDHGVWAVDRGAALAVVLAPTAGPVDDVHRDLLRGGRGIVVPAADETEFLREALPVLRRRVDVVSRDTAVVLPEASPPRLVLEAVFGRADTLRTSWHWDVDGLHEPVTAHDVPAPVVEALGGPPRDATTKGVATAEFAATVLPRLQALTEVEVRVGGERPAYRELTGAPHLTLTTVPSHKRDWFDLGVLVTVEGRTVPYAPLLEALAKRQAKMLLVDKSYLSLRHPAFDELKRLVDEATELDEWQVTAPRLHRTQVALWSEFDQLADASEHDAAWRATTSGLLALADRDALDGVATTPVPAGLHAELRPYQRAGLDWLAFLYEHRLGGVLADDMGLGKTLQTLALVAHVREQEARAHVREQEARAGSGGAVRPFLVVVPTSVVQNWLDEAARFTPGLVVRSVPGTSRAGRASVAEVAAGADVVVTSYALFRLDAESYRAEEWACLVLDEAQFVKNRASQVHRCAVELDAPVKFAITGTPLENGLLDLWSVFAVVAPGLLSSVVRFTEDYVKPLAVGGRPDLLARLRRRLRPLMLRRTKQMVAADLPAKTEQVLRVELDPSHRDVYDTVLQRERLKVLDLLDDMDRNRFIVFRSLTLLRLLALDPALVDEQWEGVPSAKLDQVVDDLVELAAEGHRALVFSQFTTFLRRVAARLEERGVAHEYLDGSTRRRAEVIGRFRGGTATAFLISLKAGGFGLTLTEADHVFVLDPWWNPAAEQQAVDRTHRIGQTRPVTVQKLIATGTVEEKVLALQAQKAALFDAVVDDDGVFSAALTADDVRGLLEP